MPNWVSFGRNSALRSKLTWHSRTLAALAASSAVAGLSEAAFLVVATATAMAVSDQSSSVAIPVIGKATGWAALGIALLLLTARTLFSFIAVGNSSSLVTQIIASERDRLCAAYLGASWAKQSSEPSGRLQELLTTFVERIAVAIMAIASGIAAGLGLLSFLVTGLVVSATSAIGILGCLLVLGFVMGPIRRRIRAAAGRLAESNVIFANNVSELATMGQEMQVFGVREAMQARLSGIAARNTELRRRVMLVSGIGPQLFIAMAYLAVLGALAVLLSSDAAQAASFAAVTILMIRALSYGQSLQSAAATVAESSPFLDKIESTIAEYAEAPAPVGEVRPRHVGTVRAIDVSYEYNDNQPILHEVCLEIRPGEMVGVIGPSGSGKSTLAQILLGLRAPTGGCVTISDGDNMTAVDRYWLADHVSFVPQQAQLLTGTLAENVRFYRSGITDERIRHALRQANLEEELLTAPGGLDSALGPRGQAISGGQRQRVSLARALASGPSMIVLDEPTSALDHRSEQLIREALLGLKGKTSLLMIAHRNTMLNDCDRILVLDKGRAIGWGSPSELRGANEYFRSLAQVDDERTPV